MAIDTKAVGKRLTELRELDGKSLSALAEEAGIAKSYLLKLEKGGVDNPGLATLGAIAKVLNTTLSQLLGAPPTNSKRRNAVGEASSRYDQPTMPSGLKEFFELLEERGEYVPADVKRSLAQIQFRGKRPQTPEDWQFIYEAVKRSVSKP